MKYIKNNLIFIIAFSAAIFIFLHSLIFMRASFLAGDSFVQFYPWFKCYSEAIKNFTFPYWINSMGSGFPLMAEGQIGGFYPLNMILFFALPFNIAYNYSIILHFILAGAGIYLYARMAGADQRGGFVAALLFCFGSAYGGCFYNIITLRTLAWFPLTLLFFEYYFVKREFKYVVFSAIILGFQFLAGFIQMAAYSALFYLAYLLYRFIGARKSLKDAVKVLVTFFSISFIIAAPQLALTYQMSLFSGREHATLGFALWRSFMPYGLFGLIFPYSISSVSAYIYVGVFSLLFVVFGFVAVKNNPIVKAAVFIFLLSLFFAIGWLNPAYVLLLKITKLYFFRNPSKFLFFGAFALAVLAGYGFTKFFELKDKKQDEKTVFIFRIVIICAGFIFLAAKFCFIFFKERILVFGYYIINNFIYNKAHHRYSLDYYTESVKSFYIQMLNCFSFANIFVVLSWVFVLSSPAILLLPDRKRAKNLAIIIISVDLFVFSFYGAGFSGSIKPFTYLAPDNPGILDVLKNDPEACRILPLDLKPGRLPNWSLPNANIVYGIDSIACYSPLVSKAYREKLLGLEVVDDSLGLQIPADDAINTYLEMARFLNVKYIITDRKLYGDFLERVMSEDGIILYRLKDYLPRIFFSYDIEDNITAADADRFEIIKYKNGFLELELLNDRNGFVVFSENYYPGWHAYVDGHEEEIVTVKGLMQGVAIREGGHSVRFIYKPYSTVYKK